ncbi:hypothetical protein L6452_19456 [Arctium lappa]|uniref:Uncharacterized protein n=1 Tax=Arctium lappa TaxID=4217 RepID=A0ACB9B873_ARCLA|nr:hypothetical protein L6452_19456 [Arctium lappa]
MLVIIHNQFYNSKINQKYKNALLHVIEAEKYLGDSKTWNRVEGALADALNEFGKPWQVNVEIFSFWYNLAGLNAISFDKGCYVGQELIAPMTMGLSASVCFHSSF